MIHKRLLLLVVSFGCLLPIIAQQPLPFLRLERTTEKINIDGVIDEATWQTGVPADNFWQYFPSDSVIADMQTSIHMAYDDDMLYVAVKCYSSEDNYITPSLRRDYRAGGNDNISLMFDTYNDQTNAFLFGMNPYGVQREALISGGGTNLNGFQTSWDNKWYGASKIYDGYWVAEMAIPFKTLRFKEGETKWRFNCYRFDTQSNERTTWVRIPRNQWIFNLAYMGDMIWEEPLGKAGTNISVIPYASSSILEDAELGEPTDYNWNIGGDAKVAITSGLNLDLTFNPDFSQVEVDQQITNLSRFEVFFPERRQFFLENADLFGSFGSRRTNPFFSRRIGVALDTTTDQNVQNTILYGARLSGKLDNNWRIGLLNMQTAKNEKRGIPQSNYTVAALQRKVFSRSNLSFLFVNKQSKVSNNDSLLNPYNRLLGFEYNLASHDNRWDGKFFYHHAITPEAGNEKYSHGINLRYTRKYYQFEWKHRLVGDDFNAEVGFVPRKDFFRITPEIRTFFYPSSGILNQHSPGVEGGVIWKPELGRTDHFVSLFWEADFRDNSRLRVSVQNEYTYLFDPFDPSGSDAEELPADTDYAYTSVQANYSSDGRKPFSFRLRPRFGAYFNGTRLGIGGNVAYRFQPFGAIAINFNYNYIKLPDPYNTANLYLIGPRIDLTFTRQLFLTTFIQYNNQIDNININARFQWRFKPVSDFFLVYTDNYTTDFGKKNRAVVAKLTYWLNL